MSLIESLRRSLIRPGSWTTAYVDGTGAEPQVVEEAREDSWLRALEQAGAPEADIQAIAERLRERAGLPSTTTHYLAVCDGEIVFDEHFAGPRFGPEIFEHGPLPVLLPLLRHRSCGMRYLVVETSRDGATLRLETVGEPRADQPENIEGSTDALPKVQAGGWSHSRWQRHSEEVWKHNQSEVAQAVERIARENRPAFIVAAGDVRARQLLREQLSSECAALLTEVPAHTRAEGSAKDQLDAGVHALLERVAEQHFAHARDLANAENGRLKAEGVSEVVHALQEARVQELWIDARSIEAPADEAGTRLSALDAEPWCRLEGDETGTAREIARIPVNEALARAAVLTDAAVCIIEHEPEEADAPRIEAEAMPPFALLRW